ncbi:plac8 onzin related protein 4 [Plectropomus leopardus]|uniref:plac8 onzin related protein 4 n=1 Tax=Plectropomus leopardus TaxID=160734 RepID=UPI001C4BDA3C|nr:plac8 onzin related protein 4 [Plectropomus leopardus]XP_042368502.1 plac8 onzin related protein 4 [Plectropomus leopardus]
MSGKMVMTQPRPLIMTTTSNQWTSGICDCFQDLPQCCLAFWCLPCFTCKTAHEAGECLCLPLLDAFGVIPPMTTALRVSVRQRYGIEGTICNDCVYSFFCGPCTWCQISREIKTRTNPITLINLTAS